MILIDNFYSKETICNASLKYLMQLNPSLLNNNINVLNTWVEGASAGFLDTPNPWNFRLGSLLPCKADKFYEYI